MLSEWSPGLRTRIEVDLWLVWVCSSNRGPSTPPAAAGSAQEDNESCSEVPTRTVKETLVKSDFLKGTALRPSVNAAESPRLQPLRELL
jgi:hypothetical protein